MYRPPYKQQYEDALAENARLVVQNKTLQEIVELMSRGGSFAERMQEMQRAHAEALDAKDAELAALRVRLSRVRSHIQSAARAASA